MLSCMPRILERSTALFAMGMSECDDVKVVRNPAFRIGWEHDGPMINSDVLPSVTSHM